MMFERVPVAGTRRVPSVTDDQAFDREGLIMNPDAFMKGPG
jgi:hypothetical protein